MYIFNQFKTSAKEFSNSYSLTAIAMLLALRVVLGYFANFTLAIFPTIKFGFSFLPLVIACIMFGPVAGACVGGFGDIISYFLNSTGGAYFPGFTISGILSGMIFGIFLYKNNCNIKNLVISWIINSIFIQILLGSFWLNIGFGMPFDVTLITRIIQNAILAVPEIILIYFFSKVVKKIPVSHKINQ